MGKKPFIITMCSGKGGTGKSVITANLASQLAKQGKRCLIWDADSMFPNQHLMFGVEPPYRLSEVYANRISLPYAIFNIKENLDLLADQPVAGLASGYGETPLFNAYEGFPEDIQYDYILLDTAAGAGSMVMQSCFLADMIIMLMTDEPTSLIDAYGLIKLLREKEIDYKVKIMLNNVIDQEDADEMYNKLCMATEHFLDVQYGYLGFVIYNRLVRKSIINQRLFTEIDMDSEVSKSITILTEQIIKLTI